MKKTCCFTGHRKLPEELIPRLKQELERAIRLLFYGGYHNFLSGGAIGFDSLAAGSVLHLKEELPGLRLILVLPCGDQDKYWNPIERGLYQRLLSGADETIFLADHYFKGCMHLRNRYLVEHSDLCLCYLTQNKGGTKYTVDYCRQKNIPVLDVLQKNGEKEEKPGNNML